MSHVVHAATLIARQLDTGDAATTVVPLAGQPGHCDAGNDYDGRLGVRISAIFVILVGSLFGEHIPDRTLLGYILIWIRRMVPSLHKETVKRKDV